MTAPAAPASFPEAALAARWAAGVAGPLRLEDGRGLRVVFPGTPAGGSGPDFTGAILDAGGDLLRGDVEIHLRASGWRRHGHATDVAYGGVVLHVAAINDEPGAFTFHRSGRLIPVLVLEAEPPRTAFPPPFTPPCAIRTARGQAPGDVLERMGLRRLRIKAARVSPAVAAHGPAQALYALVLETLGGGANREPFAALARRLPLALLLETGRLAGVSRTLALGAALKGAAAPLALRRAGLRPMASPGRRLESAAALISRWWPEGATPGWPAALGAGITWKDASAAGIGRATAIEVTINAILPVALASGVIPVADVEAAWRALPSPGTYGRLARLQSWLGGEHNPPFTSASRLQGGLLLHGDYCTRGACGRCPFSG